MEGLGSPTTTDTPGTVSAPGEPCPRCIDGPPRDEVVPDRSGDYCLVPFHLYHQKFKEKKQEESAA